MAHERLFRLGTASNLTVFALDVVLIIALYVVLMPVNRSLALLATGWGLIETATLVVVTLSDFDVLRILNGADYLHVFEANRLQALARLSVSAHFDAYNVGLVLAGLRNNCLLLSVVQVPLHPKSTGGMGNGWVLLDGSVRILVHHLSRACAKIISRIDLRSPDPSSFELTMGCWLLLKGLPPSGAAPESVRP